MWQKLRGRDAATGTAANYRVVCRSKTDSHLIAKFGTVIEEADESSFWLEVLALAGFVQPGTERALNAEANELVAIFIQGRKTAQAKRAAKRAAKRECFSLPPLTPSSSFLLPSSSFLNLFL